MKERAYPEKIYPVSSTKNELMETGYKDAYDVVATYILRTPLSHSTIHGALQSAALKTFSLRIASGKSGRCSLLSARKIPSGALQLTRFQTSSRLIDAIFSRLNLGSLSFRVGNTDK